MSLPVELVDIIFDYVAEGFKISSWDPRLFGADFETATQCSLVCRSFRPRFQKYIFRQLDLTADRTERHRELTQILVANPQLLTLIETLNLDLKSAPFNYEFAPLIPVLHSLKTSKIHTVKIWPRRQVRACYWAYLPPPLRSNIESFLCSLPSLRHLTFDTITSPFHIFPVLGPLDSLRLQVDTSVGAVIHWGDDHELLPDTLPGSPLVVQRLAISPHNAIELVSETEEGHPPPLDWLSIRDFEPLVEYDMDDDDSALEFSLWAIGRIYNVATNINSVTIPLLYCKIPGLIQEIPKPNWDRLTHLSVATSFSLWGDDFEFDGPYDPFTSILTSFARIPHPSALASIRLEAKIHGSPRDRPAYTETKRRKSQEAATEWLRALEVLTPSAFPRLTQVRIRIEVEYDYRAYVPEVGLELTRIWRGLGFEELESRFEDFRYETRVVCDYWGNILYDWADM